MYKTLLNTYTEKIIIVSDKPPYFDTETVKNKLTITNSCDNMFNIEKEVKNMRKVVRNIVNTVATVSKVIFDGGDVGFEVVGTITVSGSATSDKILKEARKAFKVDPEIQLVVTNTSETETRYEMDEETFMKYATIVDTAED